MSQTIKGRVFSLISLRYLCGITENIDLSETVTKIT